MLTIGAKAMKCLHCEHGDLKWMKGSGYYNLYWCKMCGALSHFYDAGLGKSFAEIPHTCVVDF